MEAFINIAIMSLIGIGVIIVGTGLRPSIGPK